MKERQIENHFISILVYPKRDVERSLEELEMAPCVTSVT